MASDKLTILIEKEKENLQKWKEKRAECDEKIKKSEAKIKQYEMTANNERLINLSKAVQDKGLSLDAVLLAIQNGDLLSLQEQMENTQKQKNVDFGSDQ